MNTYNATYYSTTISTALGSLYKDPVLCQQYAWWILSALCSKSQAELIAQDTIMLSPDQTKLLEQWLDQLINHSMPLQYILGFVPFCDVNILVEPPILIPRPETEEWCFYIIEHLMTLNNPSITILDIATGSGCIAVALGKAFPQARIVATDISTQAVTLAEKNTEHNHVHNITLMQSDLFQSIPQGLQFDLIVSNPPYIEEDEWKTLDPSVTHWEDYNALVADDNGLAIIKKIIAQAPQYIKTNDEMKQKNIPQLCIEIDYNQGRAVHDIAHNAHYNDILIHKDLEKKDRLFMARVDNVTIKNS